MNDTCTREARSSWVMRKQGIQHGPAPVAISRVHDQSRRLVQHDDRSVFMHDAQWNGFWQIGRCRRERLDIDVDHLAPMQTLLGIFGEPAIDAHMPRTHPRL